MVTVGPLILKDDEVKGAIFDVDGTLLDTMPLFFPSWPRTGAMPEFDLDITEEDFYCLAGRPLPDMVQHLHRTKKGCEASSEFVSSFLENKLRHEKEDEAALGHPSAIAGVVALLREYKERGVPVAIATSGLKEIVLDHLRCAGLLDLVAPEQMVFATDVPGRGKPDPAIYLEAARRIGVEPSFCRAYEDGESGLRAAYSAGMEVVDVTFMESYPLPQALSKAKEMQIKERTWLP